MTVFDPSGSPRGVLQASLHVRLLEEPCDGLPDLVRACRRLAPRGCFGRNGLGRVENEQGQSFGDTDSQPEGVTPASQLPSEHLPLGRSQHPGTREQLDASPKQGSPEGLPGMPARDDLNQGVELCLRELAAYLHGFLPGRGVQSPSEEREQVLGASAPTVQPEPTLSFRVRRPQPKHDIRPPFFPC